MVSKFTAKRLVPFTLWNARSVDKKIPAVAHSTLQNDTDVFVLTETWFNASDDTVKSRFKSALDGYTIHQIPRCRRKGGGTAVIVKSSFKTILNKTSSFKTFELLDANIDAVSEVMRLVVIYSQLWIS